MPVSYRKPRVYRRRRRPRKYPVRKRRNPRSKALTVNLRQPITSDNLITKLRYHTNITLNPGVGTSAIHLFRADSVYDPDYSGVGHQPLGFNQFETLYNHYCVIGAKLTARYTSPTSTVSSGTALATVGIQRSTTLISDLDTLIERRDHATKIMTNSNAGQVCTLVKYYSPKKVHGWTNLGSSAETRTPISTNPSDEAYFAVGLSPISSTYDTGGTTVSITIDYIVKFMERADLLQSA